MATSPNYGWSEPDNTSLVKDGAQAMRTLGDAIDTSVWNVGFGQAGKNKIINGDFSVNQRAFTSTTTHSSYGFDRWLLVAADGTSTFSAQTFTAGAAPVAGYESTNFARLVSTGQTLSSARTVLSQRVEDVRTFAGQTVTFSFWAKAASGTPSVAVDAVQVFGSGGSSAVEINGQKTAITDSWARYSLTFSVPSMSGKTIGSGSYSQWRIYTSAGSAYNTVTNSLGIQSTSIDFWGVQVEAGSKATPFQTASGGSIQGELAMCQRYFSKSYLQTTAPADGATASSINKQGTAYTTGNMRTQTITYPVTMRSGSPSITIYRTTSIATNGRWAYYTTSWQTATIGSGQINDNSFSIELGGTFTLNGSYILDGEWTASAEL